MRKPMKKIQMMCFIGLLCGMNVSLASSEQERLYLVQLVNQCEAMKPLIRAASQQQPKNQRITFHYTAWTDAKGIKRAGLLEDIQAIQTGIEEKLNHIAIEPRTVIPIQGDYLEIHEDNTHEY
jgi:RAQPRD family integrative conjugative element protein